MIFGFTEQQKIESRKIYTKALRRGDIKREPCVICGDPKTDGHHEDYSKPTDVIWLCPSHHQGRHNFLKQEYYRNNPFFRKVTITCEVSWEQLRLFSKIPYRSSYIDTLTITKKTISSIILKDMRKHDLLHNS